MFQSVVDLGLRDVGVPDAPRRLAAHLGTAFLARMTARTPGSPGAP